MGYRIGYRVGGDRPAHMRGEPRLLVCKYCGESFDSMPRLAAHISNYHSPKRRSERAEILSMLAQILEEIRRVNDNLEELRAAISNLRVTEFTRIEQVRTAEIRSSQRIEEKSKKPLPSFLQDNPWLDILSRRGRSP